MCGATTKIWNFVVGEGIWSVVVVLTPHRASLFGEFWEGEWAPANGEHTTFAFSSPKYCFSSWTKLYHQPLKTLPCKHTCAQPPACTDHPPCIKWERDDSHLPDWILIEIVKIEKMKSKSQSKARESSMASGASERVSKVGVCNERWQSVEPRSRGLGWIDSTVGCQPQQLPYRCSTAGSEVPHLQIWP